MRRRTIVIMDSDQSYAAALMGYLNRHKKSGVEVIAFSDVESLADYFRGSAAHILMISEKDAAGCPMMTQWKADLLVILTQEKTEFSGQDIPAGDGLDAIGTVGGVGHLAGIHEGRSDYGRIKDRRIIRICKYQPASRLMELVDEAGKEIGIEKRQKEGLSEVIGIFSPVRRCLKTSLALALGIHLSPAKKTMLLSFEPFSTLRWMAGEEQEESDYTLEDALYLMKSREDGAARILSETAKTGDLLYLEMVSGNRRETDPAPVEPAEWKKLIEGLKTSGFIETIIIDFDEIPMSYPSVLLTCDQIYMPYLSDFISAKRVNAFKEEITGREELSGLPIREILMKGTQANGAGSWYETAEQRKNEMAQYRESLESGELGRLAERLIREDRL